MIHQKISHYILILLHFIFSPASALNVKLSFTLKDAIMFYKRALQITTFHIIQVLYKGHCTDFLILIKNRKILASFLEDESRDRISKHVICLIEDN